MKRLLRLAVGVFFVFLATSGFFREEGEYLAPAFFGVVALYLLWGELCAAVPFLERFFRSVGRGLWGQVKATEERRYCKCCGGLAVYLVTTCVPKPDMRGTVPERRNIFVCREHHPNPDIGIHAEDLHAYIRGKVHPAATDECVFPHNPY
ncbi:MAG: hypothetical protein A3C93_00275 [Candidatus Lloydbacteria bacterium RIFCSPHIGHO2_02_FULL_54_17]|uniref:Uncharacterized protein n=1 Tax=Candidatus Lloydbacteria bacterium RIFCSPHIGHO2_02_FULL_54_17 TaxID=1798664 RepID=A0A1G2DHV6_9BACT|nr:MAG: hypothetical protein A2762_06345 [Candidatus Lloydbacteria bacterium RIFCSPHIGHO2_01_FULL_54_11]OGZ12551.1 MAG: hypothetical protein A3C93_00275 [Candidatus Lloydbacteria bacterium RIFCSPHIGHO2_02_FULL_54_17]OGZ14628.1 MAG: hypothetical protein A2948_02335 [Candidatus Lloydbacteria bacterium RIFCSPLOWO2_01_FULL_54_18]OGZ16767.1 MAG: hypothetical protein A3H76_01135 [Candidatus Lloydbacteria bacterium RIFCSPLOWO2_02_FULL_54_12]